MNGMELDAWAERVDELVSQCDRDGAPAGLLCDVHEILVTGPPRICHSIRPEISRGSLQALLDAGAFESAALRLLRNCGFMLSRGGEGLFIASVVVPLAGRDYSYSAPSEELALCGALAVSLQECLAVD
jgi:hypothetical protein